MILNNSVPADDFLICGARRPTDGTAERGISPQVGAIYFSAFISLDCLCEKK